MTIRDMLMMRTCHRRTTYKEGSSSWDYVTSYCDNWTESFFKVKPDHDPGALFFYDTSSPHTLGALIEKLTGMDLADYLRKHFKAAAEAIGEGINLKGYYIWSFIDNFEWAKGYSKRFGIVYCDYATLERIPKDSAYFAKDVITGLSDWC